MGTSRTPYPFRVVRGRMFSAQDEAVAGQGFLDLMHVKVGSWIDPTIDGVPVILHIVGRTIEPDNNGDVVDFGLDALPGAARGRSCSTASCSSRASTRPPPVRPAARVRQPAQRGGGRQPGIQARRSARGDRRRGRHPRPDRLANLLTATDVGLRDHVHEAGILKAMGFTPRQVIATLVVAPPA